MSYSNYRREYTIGDLFNDIFEGSYVKNKIPPVDVYENPSSYVIEAEVPSYSKEEVRISIQNHVLTVSAKKHEEAEGRHYLLRETANGGFSRSFRLPEDSDEASVSASAENGILTIVIPKKANRANEKVEIRIC